MFLENSLYHHPDSGTRIFAYRPVNGHALADPGHEFGGDDFKFVVAHRLHCAFVGGKRVVCRLC